MIVEEVRDKRLFQEFLRLPWRIYRGDPNWVPPLLKDLRERLSSKNPFFRENEIRLFLVRQGREAVGRIAAILNRVHLEFHGDRALRAHPGMVESPLGCHGEKVGFFGFFECVPDQEAASALFEAASSFLKEKGMGAIRGPTNPSTNDEAGLLIEGFESPPRLMMAYNPPYYQGLFEAQGMRRAKDLYAYEIEVPEVLPERVVRMAEEVRQKVRVRTVDLRHFQEEALLIREIYNEAWKENWGFVPISVSEILFLARRLKPLVVRELALIAEVEGRPVGFMLCLPDYNQALKYLNGRLGPFALLKFLYYARRIDEIRLMVFGILPPYRRKGIESLLYLESFKACRRLGYKRAELSWILEDNIATRRAAERWGARPVKRYRIYEMPL